VLLLVSTPWLVFGGDGAQFRHAHLKIAQHFQQEGFKFDVGAVNLVNQQHDRLVGHEGGEQGAGQQEVFGEEDIFFFGQAVGGVGQALHVAQDVVQGVAQQLGVEHLLGIFPLVERFAFVQPFVTLQADERPADAGLAHALASSVLPTPAGPFGQNRFAEGWAR
jgi:hypothetical protein